MPKHVFSSAVVYGAVSWLAFIAVIAAFLAWHTVLVPLLVGVALIAAGVMLVLESRADHVRQWPAMLLTAAFVGVALRIWGVL